MDTIELLAEISLYKERLKNAVEVVRCKDCRHFRRFAEKCYEWDSDGFCTWTSFTANDNEYCSDAERRSE